MGQVHTMKLFDEPFELMKNGTKSIEIRLCDEKRKMLKIGEKINFLKFSNESQKIKTEIFSITKYNSFAELYNAVPFDKIGRKDKTFEWMMNETFKIYTKEQEQKYGVVAIEIC